MSEQMPGGKNVGWSALLGVRSALAAHETIPAIMRETKLPEHRIRRAMRLLVSRGEVAVVEKDHGNVPTRFRLTPNAQAQERAREAGPSPGTGCCMADGKED